MLQAALADGTAHRRCVFEVFTRRLPAGPAVRRARRHRPRARGARRGSGSAPPSSTGWPTSAWSTTRRSTYLADYRFTGSIVGYAEGEAFFPSSPVHGGRGHVRGGGAAGDARAVDPQLRLGGRVGRVPDDERRGRPTVPGDGLAPRARGGGGRGGPGGGRRRLRRHVEPGGRAAVRAGDDRHGGARVHAPARRRGGRRSRRRSPRSGVGHDAAGGHLRRAPRRRARPGGGRARRSARCGSTPATSAVLAHEVRAQLDAAGRAEHEDHGDVRPRRVRDRGARRRAGGHLRRRHVGGHRVRGADVRDGLQARRPRGRRRGARAGGEGRPGARPASGGRKAAARRLDADGRAVEEVLVTGPDDDVRGWRVRRRVAARAARARW